jgi:hypothetical protein
LADSRLRHADCHRCALNASQLGYPCKNGGTNGGANKFLKATDPVFMSFAEDHLIDASPPHTQGGKFTKEFAPFFCVVQVRSAE